MIIPVSVSSGQNQPKFLKMVAVDLSQNRMNPIAKQDFRDPAFKTIQFMRKIKGYDFYAVAANNNIGIFSYNQSTKNFALVNLMKNVYRNMIFEICMSGDYMIPMSTGKDETIKVIEFGKGSYNSMLKKDQISDNLQHAKVALLGAIYANQKVRRLDTPPMQGNKKVDISDDGKTLYFGGDGGLVVMKRPTNSSNFKLVRNEPSLKYHGLRPTPSGHIVLQLKGSNSMVVYNKKMIKDFDFKSERIDRVESENIREPHFSNEGEQMIWFGGETSIFIVDLRTLAQKKIDNLVFSDGVNIPEPICAIADFERDKYCIVYDMNDEKVVVFHQGGQEADPNLMNEIFPKFEEILCMELHKEKLYGFIGGWTSALDYQNNPISKGVVSAFEFNKSLKLVAETELASHKCTSVSKIVVSKTNKDILYVATDGPLFVLGFLSGQKKFDVLKAVSIQNTSSK